MPKGGQAKDLCSCNLHAPYLFGALVTLTYEPCKKALMQEEFRKYRERELHLKIFHGKAK
jgi:hypothetical protein